MKLLQLHRSKAAPDSEQTTEAEEKTSAETPRTWDTGTTAAWARVMGGLLIACLVAGPLALIMAGLMLLAPSPTRQLQDSSPTGSVGESSAVSAFAEEFVTTWLTSTRGEEDRLAQYLGDVPDIDLATAAWTISAPTTAGLEQSPTTAGTWAVTVAVTVSSQAIAADRRYFTVPVTYTEGAMVAESLPFPAAAPASAAPRLESSDYRYSVARDTALAQSVSDFLAAMLSGAGDLERFTTPGAQIQAITPTPYPEGVRVSGLDVDLDPAQLGEPPESGSTVHALVTAEATAAKDYSVAVQYALTLTARAGRWEVASINPTPFINEQSSSEGEPR